MIFVEKDQSNKKSKPIEYDHNPQSSFESTPHLSVFSFGPSKSLTSTNDATSTKSIEQSPFSQGFKQKRKTHQSLIALLITSVLIILIASITVPIMLSKHSGKAIKLMIYN